MSVEVKFYDFGKLPNSTKTPASAGVGTYQIFNCELKENCDILHPSLILELPLETTMPFNVNYVEIAKFNRLYFITNWTCIRACLWECACTVDACGTYRQQIINSTQFVIRSENLYDTTIVDALAVPTSSITTSTILEDSPFTDSLSVLMGIAGGGSTRYYVFSDRNYEDFIGRLLSDEYLESVLPNWSEADPTAKFNVNPLQFITCVKAFRLHLPRSTHVSSIAVGWGELPADAYRWDPGTIWTIRKTFKSPSHPQLNQATFLCKAPYSRLNLYIPPWGELPLEPEAIYQGGSEATVEVQVDAITGSSVLYVYGGNPRVLLGSASANLSIDMPVSEVRSSTTYGSLNTITDVASIVSNFATGNLIGGINAVKSTFHDYASSLTPVHRAIGGVGAGVGYVDQIGIVGTFVNVKMPAPKFAGRPLYAEAQLSSISGYCICSNAEIGTSGTASESRDIENIMNGGIYIE